jgi:hypothetical protein
VGYGTPDQTVLLVYAQPDRPDSVRLVPLTLEPDRRYRLAGTDRVLTGAQAAAGIEVPFALATDADVVVLEAIE